MKVLIIKNRYHKKIKWKTGIDYFKKNIPIPIEIEEMETDFDLNFRIVGNATFSGVVPTGYYDNLRKIVPEGKYGAVVLVYDNDAPGIRVAITESVPLYQDTEMIAYKEADDNGKTFNHEMFHVFFKKLSRRGINLYDPMDVAIVNGKGIGYYNDTCWTCKESNRTIALSELFPYWNELDTIKTPSIVQTIKNILVPTSQPKNTTAYKYFKPNEIVGLKPELVTILDKARGIAGTSFVITSGFRTPEANKSVGGVSNSSHLSGLAVDLACTDNFKRTLILKGLYNCGSDLFIEICKSHIHIDISTANHKLGQTQWSMDD